MTVPRFDKLPIGLQDFQGIREDGYRYVDKTEHIYNLTHSCKYVFLSRPRRFGKSLLLSTLKAFYEGKRDLFEGLAISRHDDVDWEAHPVFYLDLVALTYNEDKILDIKLDYSLKQWEKLYGCDDASLPFGLRFEKVIRRACEQTGRKVVILVDEYDKPLLEAIGNPELQKTFRNTLRGFYSALKSMDAYIEFAMLTGVTKFGKLSVFSGLNNLRDISMVEQFNDICGLTEKELLENFQQNIQVMAESNDMSYEECVEELRRMYDGYHFHQNGTGMYNPYSVLSALADRDFGSYWCKSGTPTYLVALLQKHDYNLDRMSHEKISSKLIDSIDTDNASPIPVIYQSGYLTIRGYDSRFKNYELCFPNAEVEEGFTEFLVPYYVKSERAKSAFDITMFVQDVEAGNTDQFIKRLRAIFADTPYDIIKDLENHYQNILWILYKLMGFYTQAEYKTSDGRIDMVVKTPLYCYVLEFKLDGTAEEAMAQINSKEYMLPFSVDNQKIIKIGMNFSKETRNIERWVVE